MPKVHVSEPPPAQAMQRLRCIPKVHFWNVPALRRYKGKVAYTRSNVRCYLADTAGAHPHGKHTQTMQNLSGITQVHVWNFPGADHRNTKAVFETQSAMQLIKSGN